MSNILRKIWYWIVGYPAELTYWFEGKEFLVLDIKPDETPTYVTPHGTEKKNYYIRQDGESVIIDADEMINHIKKHHSAHFGSNKNDSGRWNQEKRQYSKETKNRQRYRR